MGYCMEIIVMRYTWVTDDVHLLQPRVQKNFLINGWWISTLIPLPFENFASNKSSVLGTFFSFLHRTGCQSPLANSCTFFTIRFFSSGRTCLSRSVFQTSAVHSTSHSSLSNFYIKGIW